MLARLERTFERQRRFTADASHELRTPLSVIRSLAEVALTSPRDAAYDRRVYASIAEETERLSRLVESLLALARADDGAPLELGAVDLDEVAVDAVERVAERASRQGIELVVAAAERCQVRGDASWLTQLALNLLDNALRHTPPGGRVSIDVSNAADGVTLVVSDTAPASPRSTCHTCSSGSTGLTTPARGRPAGPGSGSPSATGSPARITVA